MSFNHCKSSVHSYGPHKAIITTYVEGDQYTYKIVARRHTIKEGGGFKTEEKAHFAASTWVYDEDRKLADLDLKNAIAEAKQFNAEFDRLEAAEGNRVSSLMMTCFTLSVLLGIGVAFFKL